MTDTISQSSIIDFGNGQPALSLLPLRELSTAADHALAQADATLLQYGVDPGDEGFRASLAQFLTRRYATPVAASNLIVSAGISQALDLICTRFTKPGDTIFVEEPTYFLALDVFRDHALDVVGIPTDNDGLRIDALRDALSRRRAAMLYTIPSFQNPSGVTMSAERREQLIALSREHELLVVADEVYQLLDFGAAPPHPLATYAGADRVLSLGSFSKICAPGLRLGWIHGAPTLLDTLTQSGVVQSGGGLNPFASGVVKSLIDLGLADTVLDGLRRAHAANAAVLCNELREQLPNTTFVEPRGGYFVWLQLPSDVSASALLTTATQHGVTFHPGARFVSGGGFPRSARLSFAHYDADELVEGVRRLARAMAS
jgi:DNA-binding transcriptional MocR family regulator